MQPAGQAHDSSIHKEARMALARVVTFDGVDSNRINEIRVEMESSGGRPEGLPASEIIVLHDPEFDKALVILFFENEDDYQRGDQILGAMPAEDTPGRRTSVTKHDVAVHMVQ
jgi:hypothetical protein